MALLVGVGPDEPLIEIDSEDGTIRVHSVGAYIDDQSYATVAPIIDSVIADGIFLGDGWYITGLRFSIGRQWRIYKDSHPNWIRGE